VRRVLVTLILTGSLVAESCSRPISSHPSTFELEELYKATREIDAAVLTGASYDWYSQKLAVAEAKFLIAQDRSADNPERKSLLARYALLLDEYRSALTVWRLGLQNAHGDNPELLVVQRKYGLKISEEARRGNLTLFEDFRNQLLRIASAEEQQILPLVRSQLISKQ
jgi:hypothetical protein